MNLLLTWLLDINYNKLLQLFKKIVKIVWPKLINMLISPYWCAVFGKLIKQVEEHSLFCFSRLFKQKFIYRLLDFPCSTPNTPFIFVFCGSTWFVTRNKKKQQIKLTFKEYS